MENNLTSAAPSAKKADPGWNDPPMLNYSPSNPPPKSRIGNKRVAYPISVDQKQSCEVRKLDTSPAPPTLPPLGATIHSADCKNNENNDWNSADSLKKSMDNFKKILEQGDLDQNKTIFKLIQNMQSNWEEDKLSINIQKLVFSLSKYLLENDIAHAELCYNKLAMENPSQCGNWLISMRHLINRMK